MKIAVLYGTESGNAELVADELAGSLESGSSAEIEVIDLRDVDVQALDPATVHLVICSTHGEGEMPESALPFASALDKQRPDLGAIRYAMFGLGDSTYEHYSRGSEHLDQRLAALGAQRIGAYGRHDAASGQSACDLAIAWADEVLQDAGLSAPR